MSKKTVRMVQMPQEEYVRIITTFYELGRKMVEIEKARLVQPQTQLPPKLKQELLDILQHNPL